MSARPDSAAPVDMADALARAAWCVELNATNEELLQAVESIGAMPNALRVYFARPRPPRASAERKAAYERMRAAKPRRRVLPEPG